MSRPLPDPTLVVPVMLNMLNDLAWLLIKSQDEEKVQEAMPHIVAVRKVLQPHVEALRAVIEPPAG